MTAPAAAGSPQASGGQASPEEVRAELAVWVREHWDPDLPLQDWRGLLLRSGWAVPSWPRRWHGRGLPAWADELVGAELIRLGAVGVPVGSGTGLAAPTMLAHGDDQLRERLLEPVLTGAQTWCQLFSEPGAGSDLAGLTTTAVLDGDTWVVSGQKVWNTGAHHADMAMLLARTDWNVPKHQGLTYFALPMHQPGVEVRQLRQMNFHASFNEVFLTEARIPRENVVGTVGQGWKAALTTLAYERRLASLHRPAYADGPGRALAEARAEADEHFATYSWYPQRAGRPDLLIEHARAAGVSGDPIVRQAIARVITMQRVSEWTAERARIARALGARPGAEGSLGKLASSAIARESARAHSMIAAAAALLTGPDSVMGGVIGEVLMSVPGQSIAGGTDEIQKNIVAEKMLGLPGEIRVDKDVPFSQVRRRG